MKKIISIITSILICATSINLAFAEGENIVVSSKSAILMDVSSGQILYEKSSHEKLPPASVTKVMTMLLIMEAIENGKVKIDDKVQVSENASSMGGSQIFLEQGDNQKVDDLIKAIAVASANDACVAMAEHVAGTVEEFVSMMNDKAQSLGMNDTHFSNTNGLPADNHYTSAYDIAIMSRELLKHEAISKYLTIWMDQVVVGKKNVTVGLANTNKLVKHYDGTTGVKTGFTKEAKYCLSASAKRGDTHLLAVTLGAETTGERFKDATSLLNYGFVNYESVKICKKDDIISKIESDKAESRVSNLVAKEDLYVLIKKGDSKEFTKKITLAQKISLPVKKGTTLGALEVYNKDKLIGKINLINNCDINKASYVKMLQRVIEDMV